MALFDRFRQPKWKHADPAIRLEAVNELGDDAQDVLRSLAREDADPGVRRRAVARVEDIGTLASVARSDMDEGVRAEARKLLMDLATDGSNEAEALEALAGLDDERDLAVIARTTDAEAVGLAALRRVSAPRLVGSVAGRAVRWRHPPGRPGADDRPGRAAARRAEQRAQGRRACRRSSR